MPLPALGLVKADRNAQSCCSPCWAKPTQDRLETGGNGAGGNIPLSSVPRRSTSGGERVVNQKDMQHQITLMQAGEYACATALPNLAVHKVHDSFTLRTTKVN